MRDSVLNAIRPADAPDAPGALAVSLTLSAAFFAAVCYAYAPLQRLSTGDELIPVLISTQSLSLFYWGADRFGTLIAVLAAPFANPLTNFVVQNVLCACAAFASFFALARLLFGRVLWLPAGALMVLIAIAWPPLEPMGHYMSIGQSFATSAALLLAGMLVLRGGGLLRSACALALFCLGLWVNISLLFTVAPLLAVEALLGQPDATLRERLGRLLRGALLLGVALAVNYALMRVFASRYAAQDYSLLPPAIWPEAFGSLARNVAASFLADPLRNAVVAALVAVPAGLALLARRDVRGRGRGALLLPLTVLLAVGLTNMLGYGTNAWVRINHFEGRYLTLVAVAGLCVACGASCVLLQRLSPRIPRLAACAAAVLTVAASAHSFGMPSEARLAAGFEERFGAHSSQILAEGCTHVAGGYWKVWPLVFHANLKRYAAGGAPVWGVSYRAENTAPLWERDAARPWTVCVLAGDGSVAQYLRQFGLTGERTNTIDLPHFEH